MSKNNVNALYNYTFWYWEYLRRNQEYIQDCEFFNDALPKCDISCDAVRIIESRLLLFMKEIEYQFTNSAQPVFKVIEYFSKLLLDACGEDAHAPFMEFSEICVRYRVKYGFFDGNKEGPVSESILHGMVSGVKYKFLDDTIPHLLMAIRSYKEWSISKELVSVFETHPDTIKCKLDIFCGLLFNYIRPEIRLSTKKDIVKSSLEAVALKCLHKGFTIVTDNFLNNKNDKFSDDELNAIYELVVSGRRLVRANDVRTVGIWLWDKVQEYGVDNVEKSFLKAHDELTKRFAAYVGTANRLINRTDAREIYETTDKCIKTKEVLHVAAKKSKKIK